MAGDWIKFRSELWTHPRFIALVNGLMNVEEGGLAIRACGTDALGIGAYPPSQAPVTEVALRNVTEQTLREVTMAALLRVWCMVNSHCKVEGNDAVCAPMSLDTLDGIAGIDGFGHMLGKVKWVDWEPERDAIVFRNFLEFNEPACLRYQPLSNAERQARFREKNKPVTRVTKSNGREEKRREDIKENTTTGSRKNGAHQASADDSPILETLPLRDGGEFQVKQSLVTQLEPIYPAVDVPKTLKEMKGWLLLNADRRKTRAGVKRFIGNWLQSEQEKHGG